MKRKSDSQGTSFIFCLKNVFPEVLFLFGLINVSSAAVVYRDLGDLTVPPPSYVVDGFETTWYSELALDIDDNGVIDYKLYQSGWKYWDGAENEGYDNRYGVLGLNGNTSDPATYYESRPPEAGIPYGDLIDSTTSPYSYYGRYVTNGVLYGDNYGTGEFCCRYDSWGAWHQTTDMSGYIGLQFYIDGAIHYAWLLASLDPWNAGQFIAHELAYETTPGLGIQAGVIPVPVPVPAVGPLAMLTVVAMGALGLRRKKQL